MTNLSIPCKKCQNFQTKNKLKELTSAAEQKSETHSWDPGTPGTSWTTGTPGTPGFPVPQDPIDPQDPHDL